MAIKKTKDASDDIEFHVYRDAASYLAYCIRVTIDLNSHIDWYSYHDAPSSVRIDLTLEDLESINNKINKAIADAKKLALRGNTK